MAGPAEKRAIVREIRATSKHARPWNHRHRDRISRYYGLGAGQASDNAGYDAFHLVIGVRR